MLREPTTRNLAQQRSLQQHAGFSQIDTFTYHWQEAPEQRRRRAVRPFKRWTRATVREMLITGAEKLRELTLSNLKHWQLRSGTRRSLHAMLGIDDAANLLASSLGARVQAGFAAIEWIVAEYRRNPQRHFYHATFVDDRHRTRDRVTRIDLTKIKKPVRALLREHGIRDWFGMVEFKPYSNARRGHGRLIAPHTHVVFWTDRAIDHEALEAELSASCRLTSFDGAPTVKIVKREGRGELAHMIAYLFKSVDRAGNLVHGSHRRNGRSATYDASLRPNLAVRMVELMSHFQLSELMLASGAGMEARRYVVADLKAWLKQQRGRTDIKKKAVPLIWANARRQARKEAYAPIEIVGR